MTRGLRFHRYFHKLEMLSDDELDRRGKTCAQREHEHREVDSPSPGHVELKTVLERSYGKLNDGAAVMGTCNLVDLPDSRVNRGRVWSGIIARRGSIR